MGGNENVNIHHNMPITPVEAFTSIFKEFTKCIKTENTNLSPHLHFRSNHIITFSLQANTNTRHKKHTQRAIWIQKIKPGYVRLFHQLIKKKE